VEPNQVEAFEELVSTLKTQEQFSKALHLLSSLRPDQDTYRRLSNLCYGQFEDRGGSGQSLLDEVVRSSGDRILGRGRR
jgi:hypothetical protein